MGINFEVPVQSQGGGDLVVGINLDTFYNFSLGFLELFQQCCIFAFSLYYIQFQVLAYREVNDKY